MGRVGPQFSDQAWVRAARTFYSVKELKTSFRAGLGQKKFAGFKISAHACPPSKIRGQAWLRLKMLRYTYHTAVVNNTLQSSYQTTVGVGSFKKNHNFFI
jgi:hypothetical protein